jgi:hypothetical protein
MVRKSKLITFAHEAGEILLENPNIEPVDVLIFGGEPYRRSRKLMETFLKENMESSIITSDKYQMHV